MTRQKVEIEAEKDSPMCDTFPRTIRKDVIERLRASNSKADQAELWLLESVCEKPIDTDYTDEIVCPYCGHKNHDSWEYNDNGGKTECVECGEIFDLVVDIDITYCTSKRD